MFTSCKLVSTSSIPSSGDGRFGSVKNVFFRTTGSIHPSTVYWCQSGLIKHCTFFHDTGSMSSSWDNCLITVKDCASNNFNDDGNLRELISRKSNVISDGSYGLPSSSLSELIADSKNNANFNNAEVGIFYGDNAWQ